MAVTSPFRGAWPPRENSGVGISRVRIAACEASGAAMCCDRSGDRGQSVDDRLLEVDERYVDDLGVTDALGAGCFESARGR